MIEPPPALISEPNAPPKEQSAVRWLEIALVMMMAYAPSALSQLFGGKEPVGPLVPYYEFVSVSTMIALLLLIVWVRDGTLANVGIRRPRLPLDPALGVALCMSFFITSAIIYNLIPRDVYNHWRGMGQSAPLQDQVTAKLPMSVVLSSLFVVNSFEEIVMRGYLTGRLASLLRYKWLAVLISSILFATWHIYQGPVGIMSSFVIGLILGTTFLVTGRIWPLIVAHFGFDAIITLMYWLQSFGHRS